MDTADLMRLGPSAQKQILCKMIKKPSKYHSTKVWLDGICFDSKKESLFYAHLKLLHAAKIISGFLYHGNAILTAGSDKEHRATTYETDFVLLYQDGHYEIVDTKGMETDVFKLKMKIMREKYPEVEVKIE